MTGSPENPAGKVFCVDIGGEGQRLDQWLAGQMPEYVSRNRVQAMIKAGVVQIDGVVAREPKRKLKQSERISLRIPDLGDPEPSAENIPLDVLFEDESLIVVNKPAGMVVHPAAGNWTGTLVNALLYHCGDSLKGIGGVKRPGIVHRLDKETSGVLVIAKTDEAHADLAAQFADHGRTRKLDRRYLALVWGSPTNTAGKIETSLGRSRTNRLKRAVVNPDAPDAKHAVTHYRVIKRLGADNAGQALASLLECRLETGRTHQIRVHLAHIYHPLIGDREYGKHFETKTARLSSAGKTAAEALGGQALHAAILAFEHPVTGDVMRFEVPPPKPFQALIDALEDI